MAMLILQTRKGKIHYSFVSLSREFNKRVQKFQNQLFVSLQTLFGILFVTAFSASASDESMLRGFYLTNGFSYEEVGITSSVKDMGVLHDGSLVISTSRALIRFNGIQWSETE